MTALAAAVRPGIGWVAVLAVAILLAGTGFLLVMLPFDVDAEAALDADRTDRIQCPTPLARAFDDVIATDSWCAVSARTRVKTGAVALAIGLAGTTVASRRLNSGRYSTPRVG